MPADANGTYAGFWVRFLAVCIDLVLSAPFYYGFMFLFGAKGGLGDALFCLLFILIYAFCFSGRWQATPGMYVLGFRITDAQGNRIGFGRALYWVATSIVAWIVCLAGVVYLQSRFDLQAIQQLQMSCIEQNISMEDCAHEIESITNIPYPNFTQLIYAAGGLALFMLLIWALSIALPRDKTGFHNLLCGTRFLKGRAAG